jgi:hypothetical protein
MIRLSGRAFALVPLCVLYQCLCANPSLAQEAAPAPDVPPPPSTEPAPAPRPQYSLPFQLRPVMAVTGVRSDTSLATYDNLFAQNGLAVVSELSGSWRIPGTGGAPGAGLAPMVKLTIVDDSPPGAGTGGFAFVNPLVGASYAFALGSGFRASAFAGVTIPVGMGGGDTPNKGASDARSVGQVVRAGMDNSLFAVDDLALIPGLDLAYVRHGLTVQVEATLFQLERVRGAKAQLEASKTNLTAGLHVGYFFTPFLSLGTELRVQSWLNPPFTVQNHKPNTSYDLTSIGVGPRFHFHVAQDVWIRPGIAYTRGFDPPMTPKSLDYNVVQVDVPVVF